MAAIEALSMSDQELMCTYAALILHDEKLEVTADKIETLVKSTGAKIEPYMPPLFERALKTQDIGVLLSSVGSAPAAAAAAPAAAAAAAPAAAKEEEKKEESEDEGDLFGGGLFD
eukprot:GHVU01171701.1.p1 GENE.GHVU01171701.1~~GHVU01171701.1.p1  ORF type:complete len:115 (-),score=36.27 GHVU01171701.1:227-571(-)